MLDRQLIRENPDFVRTQSKRKGVDAPVDEFLRIDAAWREARSRLDDLNAESNRISKSIGQLMAQGKRDEAEQAKADTGRLKSEIQATEAAEREWEAQLREVELKMPNLPHESVPDGSEPEQNAFVREWGEKPSADRAYKEHWDVAAELGLLDFERAAKVSGSGFALYRGWGARLQRALFNWMIDHQVDARCYEEVFPPYCVNRASLEGTGNLPKFEEDLYRCDDDLFLIPTAEVPVTNMLRDEILELWQLPMKMAAYSACFRREAGAAGKDTRGLLRLHQFDKVEIVKFTLPETSYAELETLTEDAESVLQALGLHYRVMLLCAGDMGDKGAKTYDLEVWSPGVGRYLEISSCTNFEAYQSRRVNVRFRRGQGERPEFPHILNGSGVACARLFAALVETYYDVETGVLQIPAPLRRYMGVESVSPETP